MPQESFAKDIQTRRQIDVAATKHFIGTAAHSAPPAAPEPAGQPEHAVPPDLSLTLSRAAIPTVSWLGVAVPEPAAPERDLQPPRVGMPAASPPPMPPLAPRFSEVPAAVMARAHAPSTLATSDLMRQPLLPTAPTQEAPPARREPSAKQPAPSVFAPSEAGESPGGQRSSPSDLAGTHLARPSPVEAGGQPMSDALAALDSAMEFASLAAGESLSDPASDSPVYRLPAELAALRPAVGDPPLSDARRRIAESAPSRKLAGPMISRQLAADVTRGEDEPPSTNPEYHAPEPLSMALPPTSVVPTVDGGARDAAAQVAVELSGSGAKSAALSEDRSPARNAVPRDFSIVDTVMRSQPQIPPSPSQGLRDAARDPRGALPALYVAPPLSRNPPIGRLARSPFLPSFLRQERERTLSGFMDAPFRAPLSYGHRIDGAEFTETEAPAALWTARSMTSSSAPTSPAASRPSLVADRALPLRAASAERDMVDVRAPEMPLPPRDRTAVSANASGLLIQRSELGSAPAGTVATSPDPSEASAQSQGPVHTPEPDSGGANDVNLLANEVWSLLRRRLAYEAERMGR